MRLALGPESFDISTRALVVAMVGDLTDLDLLVNAERSYADGADILEVTAGPGPGPASMPGDSGSADVHRRVEQLVRSLLQQFHLPICVSTSSPAILAAASTGGATMMRPGAGDPERRLLEVAADAGIAVVVCSDADDSARGAGAPAGVVGAEASTRCAHLLALARFCEEAGMAPGRIVVDSRTSPVDRAKIVALGYPVMACTLASIDPDGAAIALADLALAVITGCRVIRTAEVRRARRVVDAVAAILEAP